jgi:RND family efflux transporter MFP subunit
MKRFIAPILGLVVLIITVVQVRANRVGQAPASVAPASTAQPTRIIAEGRVVTYPGGEVTVGSDVAGTIDKLDVREQDVVHKGDVIATLRSDDLRAALAEARAHVGEAEADIRMYELDLTRAKRLFGEDVGSKQAWEKSERDLDAARARRASAIAATRRLEAVVAKSVIVAPIDGIVIARMRQRGETISAGDSLVTIADIHKTRIEAEVDEYDASRVRNGGEASISAEGYDAHWRGVIEEVPDNVVSRRLKPQDPSRPIDTRVLLVKVAFGEQTPLKLGQRVDVEFGR